MSDSLVFSPIVRLPTEIHSLVLKELDRESLLRVRLTCKTLTYHATPLIFKRLHVWLEEDSLQKLVNIANEPHLQKHVRFIDFGMDLFYDISGPQFKRCMLPQHSSPRALKLSKSDAAIVKSAWNIYRRYYIKQHNLTTTGRDLAMFARAIAAFSALESIRLVDFQWYVEGTNKGPKLLKKETLLRQDMLNADSIAASMPVGWQQLSILIRALAASRGDKLQNLQLHLHSPNISREGFYSTLSAEDANFAKSAFSGLKRLSLNLAPVSYTIQTGWKKTSTESSVATILKAATEVEELQLAFPIVRKNHPRVELSSEWKDLIQPTCFGKLKTLSIKRAILNEAEFVSFLTQSCQELKRLDLWGVRVVEDSWDRIFQTIIGLPELVEVCIKEMWYSYSSRQDGSIALYSKHSRWRKVRHSWEAN
ncbi:MAG: hypothetical protein Q9195_004886 [Heterodermia aff. obscurata]